MNGWNPADPRFDFRCFQRISSVGDLLKALTLCSLLAAPARAGSQCVVCHATLGDKHQAILRSFEGDIHKEKGLSCHSCHGGNPDKEDMGEAKDASFIGAPSKAGMPHFCGRCHSDPAFMKKYNPSLPVDQEAKYLTSVHGTRLKAGDAKAAACANCHPAHSIRPAKDPVSSVYPQNIPQTCGKCHADAKLMAPYRLPADQVEKYKRSVHGRALLDKGDSAAPVCNTCHGNHGAQPPGIANIGHVCGMCHANNEEFFKGSPMARPWEKKKFHMCATCHSHHDVQKPSLDLLSPETGLCRKCHLPSSHPFAVASAMKAKLASAESSYRAAELSIAQAEEKGMDMAEARDALDSSRTSLYQAKTAVHTFNAKKVAELADLGTASAGKAKKSALDAVGEFMHRRIGLGVATLLIAFLAGALYLKVRDIES